MNKISLKLVLIAVFILLLVCVFPVAADTTTTIDFEKLSHGELVTNQYQKQGVVFSGDTKILHEILKNGTVYNIAGYPPHSGSNVAYSPSTGKIRADFTSPVSKFGVYYWSKTKLYLEAYDKSGKLIASTNGSPDTNGYTPNKQESQLILSKPGISYVMIQGTANYFVIDDLSFTSSTSLVANFTSNVTNGTAPLSVQFKDTSKGSPTSWSWNFGDKNTSTKQNPINTYYKAGKYTISLKVTNADGSNTTTKVNYINVTNLSNIFYPGIGWQASDTIYPNEAKQLNAKMMNSYMNTGMDDGAFQVYLASLIPPKATTTNYLMYVSDFGSYNVAFAHSGGTRTLVDKIESRIVKANYVVLASPAMLTQPELQDLSKYGVKQVVVYQSPYDILPLLYVTLEKNHQFTILGVPSTVAPAMVISLDKLPLDVLLRTALPILGFPNGATKQQIIQDMHNKPDKYKRFSSLFTFFALKSSMNIEITNTEVNGAIDLTPYLKSAVLDKSIIPVSKSFWIGGSGKIGGTNQQAPLFSSNGIVIVVNPPIDPHRNPKDVHSDLGKKMANDYANNVPPFDGTTIPGLKGLK